jgi:flagellar hook protein FlgE
MTSAFSTALSALSAHARAVDVVGNNLANLNTAGYKANSVAFFDVVSQSLGSGLGSAGQVGFGVNRPVALRQFSQGAIQTTGGALDAAIQGDGFLVVRDSSGRQMYTRGGNLLVDRAGNLITAKGQRLQGWMADAAGVVNSGSALTGLALPVGTLQRPSPTTSFSLDLNLNAAAAPGATFASSIVVFDSLGASHVVTVQFTKAAGPGEWEYSISVPDDDVTTPVTPLTGTLTFSSSGELTSPAVADPVPQFTITGLRNGAADLTLDWRLFSGATPRVTQFAQPSAVSANAQDGAPAAQLLRVTISDGGGIFASYSDGRQVMVGQLAMASIRNPESLIAVGDNSYELSAASADPAIGLPGTGGRGTIIGGAIESSTVDLAREFTNLIVFQRGYQASTRVITTADEMSQETLNLKR